MRLAFFFVAMSLAVAGVASAITPGQRCMVTACAGRVVLPLDAIKTPAYSAWGVRKLRAAYTGNLTTVRRSSDSTTSGISFVGNNLDTGTLFTFCALTNCFNTVMNDQSGVTNCQTLVQPCNVSQGTTAQQPQIVTSGAATSLVNGHPGLFYTGSVGTNMVNSVANFNMAVPISAFAVGVPSTGDNSSFGNSGRGILGTAGTAFGLNFLQGTFCTSCFVGYKNNADYASVNITYGVPAIFAVRLNASNANPLRAYVNGGTPGTNSSATVTGTSSSIELGCHRGCGANSNAFDGTILEAYFFQSELSIADSNTLGANIASYWGLTWTPISQ